jgi:hypothetical protein
MAVIAMAMPILPDKFDSWRERVDALTGSRREEFGAARRRQGVTRQRVWLQQTPAGPLEILLLETDDPARTFGEIATSQEPFDVWFRQFVLEHYGIDLTQPAPGPPSELLLDWAADQ